MNITPLYLALAFQTSVGVVGKFDNRPIITFEPDTTCPLRYGGIGVAGPASALNIPPKQTCLFTSHRETIIRFEDLGLSARRPHQPVVVQGQNFQIMNHFERAQGDSVQSPQIRVTRRIYARPVSGTGELHLKVNGRSVRHGGSSGWTLMGTLVNEAGIGGQHLKRDGRIEAAFCYTLPLPIDELYQRQFAVDIKLVIVSVEEDRRIIRPSQRWLP